MSEHHGFRCVLQDDRDPLREAAAADRELQQAIRAVVLDAETPVFDKRRQIATLVEEELRTRGQFLRTADDRAFFFHRGEHHLHDLDQTNFHYLLTAVSACPEFR